MTLTVFGAASGAALLRWHATVPTGGVSVGIVPLQSLAERLAAGTGIPVSLVIGAGESPHTYIPHPSDIARATGAKLLVVDGIHDTVVLDLAEAAPLHPRILRLAALEQVQAALPPDLARRLEAATHAGEGGHEGHDHGEEGHEEPPHAWLDPRATAEIVRAMAAAMQDEFPAHRQTIAMNLAPLIEEIDALDRELAARTAALVRRDFLAVHPAFESFARRYGLELLDTIETTAGLAPTLTHVARLQELVRSRKLRVLFVEPQLSAGASRVLAEELDLHLIVLDPLGRAGEDYFSMMRRAMTAFEHAEEAP